MLDDIGEIGPSDVTFVKQVKESKNSMVFQVVIHARLCIMKVYHTRVRKYYHSPHFEVDLFVRESLAYKRLEGKGFCKRGVIPNFYGTVENIQPSFWPSLHMFLKDEHLPNAIIIEFVPDIQEIDLSSFSIERAAKLREILLDFHQAGVVHSDLYPRNIMIAPGKPYGVLWIDFDSAVTLPEDSITERQQSWIDNEVELMDEFTDNMTQDCKEGKLNQAWKWYYHYS